VLVDDGHRVVIKAIVVNANGVQIGSGMAEEIRGQGHVNTTSALENCETSAVGRALSSIGLSGGEYASANELDAVGRKTEAMSENKQAEETSSFNPDAQKARDFMREVDMKCSPANMKTSTDFNALVSPDFFAGRMKEAREHAPEVFNQIEQILAQAARRLKVEW
jgi:hypothetical protein